MNDNSKYEERLKVIFAKDLLYSVSTDDLINNCSDIEEYFNTLNYLESILINEKDYLTLNNFIDKYQSIINYGRFKFPDKKLNSYQNEIIYKLNNLDSVSSDRKESYILDQFLLRFNLDCRNRNLDLESLEKIVLSASDMDFEYLRLLSSGADRLIKDKTDKILFLSSTAYYIENIKEVYSEYPNLLTYTKQILSNEKKDDLIRIELRKNAKKLEKKLKKI